MLRVESSVAIGHATAREEVHVVVVSEPFLFFPGGGTMEGDEGRRRRREKEKGSNCLYLFFLKDAGKPEKLTSQRFILVLVNSCGGSTALKCSFEVLILYISTLKF